MEEEKSEHAERDKFGREMHDAVCSDCGKKCQVPFKPMEGKPVYCRECFQKHRKPRHEGSRRW